MKKISIGAAQHQIGELFTFALVALFAVLALFLAVIGIKDYQSVLDATDVNNDARVAMGYVANKIRTCDEADLITVKNMDGRNVLVLKEMYDGDEYETRIYHYDGVIMEQGYEEGEEFLLEDGTEIVGAQAFDITMENGGLVRIKVKTDDDRTHEMYIAVRSARS